MKHAKSNCLYKVLLEKALQLRYADVVYGCVVGGLAITRRGSFLSLTDQEEKSNSNTGFTGNYS